MKIARLFDLKFEVFFAALLLHLLHPFLSLLFITSIDITRFVSFLILVLASFNLAMKRRPKYLVIGFGLVSAFGLMCQSLLGDPYFIHLLRIYSTCFFYMVLIFILTKNFLESKSVNLKVVIGAMSGYLLIGYLGASIVEMMEFHYFGSFHIITEESFDFTYFSFVSLLTVGYGDVIPKTAAAKSLSVLISLVGQLYMAVGIASFVGKFMKRKL